MSAMLKNEDEQARLNKYSAAQQAIRNDDLGPVLKPFAVGNVWFDRVEEYYGSSNGDTILSELLVGWPEEANERLGPTTIMPEHSWIVRTPHYNVVIDPTWGNDKHRPGFGNMLKIPWLERFALSGLEPADIDYVFCTHMHTDHVGWNTKLVDEKWVPTFPNARYLFPRKDYEYWSTNKRTDFGHDLAFQDSVLPIVEAGLSELIDEGYTIDNCLTTEYATGHTVGHMTLKVQSRGESAVFMGDSIHTPKQVYYPLCNTIICDLQEEASQTRLRVLSECARNNTLLIGAHFPAPYIGRVKSDGKGAFIYMPGFGPVSAD